MNFPLNSISFSVFKATNTYHHRGREHQSMACSSSSKMKGLLKGIRYISQIFVHKEHEMEIGYPTDVTHVAHVGFDNPFWMDEFKSASDFSGSLSNYGSADTSWASQDFDQQRELHPAAGIFMDKPLPDIPKAPKKKSKRKKKEAKSPTSSASRSSFSTTIEDDRKPNYPY